MLNCYWKYAGTQYRRKFQAIQAAQRNIDDITFHLVDESLFNYNYRIEPTESLEELIKERCLELRDTYPYIKFFFSGGFDSTTVLNSFLKNNIYIDEIIVYRFSMTDNFLNKSNIEVNDYVFTYLKSLNLRSKISTQDWGTKYVKKYFAKDNWFEKRNSLYLREVALPNIRGKNFCNLYGTPDARIDKINGEWQLFAWDTEAYSESLKFRNTEFFFLTPKLLAKQAHLVKNYCNLHNINSLSYDACKELQRLICRDEPISKFHFPKQWSQSIKSENYPPVLRGHQQKEVLLLKEAPQIDKDKYRAILSTKIAGIPVVRLLRGYEVFRFNIGR